MSTEDRIYEMRPFTPVLNDLINPTPERVYATILRLTKDLSQGCKDTTVSDVARCVNALAWWFQKNIGRSTSFETLCYIWAPQHSQCYWTYDCDQVRL